MAPTSDLYEVERILAHRDNDGRFEYLIRWKGFSSEWDTWEPVENLDDCENLITAFHQSSNSSPIVSPHHIVIGSMTSSHVRKNPGNLKKSVTDNKKNYRNLPLHEKHVKAAKASGTSPVKENQNKPKIPKQAAPNDLNKDSAMKLKMAAKLVKRSKETSVKSKPSIKKQTLTKKCVPSGKKTLNCAHTSPKKIQPALKTVTPKKKSPKPIEKMKSPKVTEKIKSPKITEKMKSPKGNNNRKMSKGNEKIELAKGTENIQSPKGTVKIKSPKGTRKKESQKNVKKVYLKPKNLDGMVKKRPRTVVSTKIKKTIGKAPIKFVVKKRMSSNMSSTDSEVNEAEAAKANFKKCFTGSLTASFNSSLPVPVNGIVQTNSKQKKSLFVKPLNAVMIPKNKNTNVKNVVADRDNDSPKKLKTSAYSSSPTMAPKVGHVKIGKTIKDEKQKVKKRKMVHPDGEVVKKKIKRTTSSKVHPKIDDDDDDDDSDILYSLSNDDSPRSMDTPATFDTMKSSHKETANLEPELVSKPKKMLDKLTTHTLKKSPLIAEVIDLKSFPVIDLGEKVEVTSSLAFKKPQKLDKGILKMKSVRPVQHPVSPTPLFTTVKPMTSSVFRPQTITSASAMLGGYCGDMPTYQFFPSVPPISPSSMSYRALLDSLPSQLHPKKSKRKETDRIDEEAERIERRISVRQSECAFRYKCIVVKKCEKYTQIWLNSQTKMKNALNPLVIQEVISALNSAKYDDSNLVMFSGLGNVFCSGLDLDFLIKGDRKVVAREMVDALRDFTKALITFSKPVVAVVSGPAVGIGMTMLPLCDVVYASDKATFSLPYAQLAQTPEGCATYTLPLAIGMAMTNELLIGGRKITAIEACQLGLVSQVLWPTSMMQEVIPRIQNMALLSGKSLETTKLLIRSHQRTKLELTNESECNLLLERWSSPDCQKAIQAYLGNEKNLSF